MKQLKNEIIKEQKKVASSKDEAVKYLISIGVLTQGGNIKRNLKGLQH